MHKKPLPKKSKAKKKAPPRLKTFRATVVVLATRLEDAVALVKDGKWADILEVAEDKSC